MKRKPWVYGDGSYQCDCFAKKCRCLEYGPSDYRKPERMGSDFVDLSAFPASTAKSPGAA